MSVQIYCINKIMKTTKLFLNYLLLGLVCWNYRISLNRFHQIQAPTCVGVFFKYFISESTCI